MNAQDLIQAIRDAGASNENEVLTALNNRSAMGSIFGLPRFDPNVDKVINAHYQAMRTIKNAYKIVKGC